MDIEMEDDSLISLVGDSYNTPNLDDEVIFPGFPNRARTSLGSSDPVDVDDDDAFRDEELDDGFEDEDVESLVEEPEEDITFDEGVSGGLDEDADVTEDVEDDADLSDGEFAAKADDLAGIKEMTEKEAKATRQGPAITRQEKEAPPLELGDFKSLIDHHIAETSWKYTLDPLRASPQGEIRISGIRSSRQVDRLGEAMKGL